MRDPMLDAYLDAHWHFRTDPKYLGLLGRIGAHFDRVECERREALQSGPLENCVGHLYGSSPIPEDEYRRYVEARLRECSFADAMMRIIARKGLDPSDVYRRAGVDRRLFSKIRSRREYRPAKTTILALCIGMRLTADETRELLEHCGFCLSDRILTDVVVQYFLESGIHDIGRVNEALASYGVGPLV